MSTKETGQASGAVLDAESEVTPAELIRRAEEIAPTLVPRQGETEQRTFYAEDTHRAFQEAGFYRILVPRRYGGFEFGIDTFLRVMSTIARGCPSTGWMLCLGTSHAHTVASMFDEQAQAELFADGDFICPTTLRPQGSATREEDGGWRMDGTWNYCSGSPYATHFMSQTFPGGVPGPPMLFIAPRSEWTRLDDWGHLLGLKGSGSHSIRFENGRIPAHYAQENTSLMNVDVTKGTPGLRLHGNSLYAGSPYSFFLLEAAALAVGFAKGALDVYDELMRKPTMLPPIVPRTEDPDYQRWYGTGAGKIATAEAACLQCAAQWMEAAEQRTFTRERDMRLVSISREVIDLCWNALQENLFRSAGSSSVSSGSRMERVWRDFSTLHSHTGFVAFSEMATRELARARFAEDT